MDSALRRSLHTSAQNGVLVSWSLPSNRKVLFRPIRTPMYVEMPSSPNYPLEQPLPSPHFFHLGSLSGTLVYHRNDIPWCKGGERRPLNTIIHLLPFPSSQNKEGGCYTYKQGALGPHMLFETCHSLHHRSPITSVDQR